MKKSRKFLKVLSVSAIAAMMAAAMVPTVAFAANTTYAVTVGSSGEGSVTGTYNVYKVATVTPSGTSYTYEYEDDFESYETNYDLESVVGKYADNSSATSITSSDAQKLANKLANTVEKNSILATESNITLGTSVDLEPGYYLVTISTTDSGIVAAPSLVVVTNEDKSVNVKTSTVGIEKKITGITEEGSVSGSGDTGVAEIGATVKYTLTADIPNYATDVIAAAKDATTAGEVFATPFTITDDPSDGIKYESTKANMTVQVNGLDVDTKYYTVAAEGDGFKITFNDNFIGDYASAAGAEVVVTFDAVVDTDADLTTNGNLNTATLDYSNQYATGKGAADKDDTVKVYSASIVINKKDEKGNSLTGAGFTIYKSEDGTTKGKAIKTLTSTADKPLSTFTFGGLDEGWYIIEETTVPDGGYKKAPDVAIEITADQDASDEYDGTINDTDLTSVSQNVVNSKGATLPGTGGMGTTIFTIAGLGTIVVAGAALTIYMKKRRTEEE